jgi:hypothetical protein
LIVDLPKIAYLKWSQVVWWIQQIKINNPCQHSVRCPRYISSHKLNQLNWVKTPSDIVFLIFLINLQTMPNMCKYFQMIRPTLCFSFVSQIVQIEWKLKEILYLAMTTTPNNAKHSLNDSPMLYFAICSEMNLIGQEMGEIQDFDCRFAQKAYLKWSQVVWWFYK